MHRKIFFENLPVVLNALYNKRKIAVKFRKRIPQLFFSYDALLIRYRIVGFPD